MQYVYVLTGDVDYEPGTMLGVFGSQAAMQEWLEVQRAEFKPRGGLGPVATLGYDSLTCTCTSVDSPDYSRTYVVAIRP